MDLHRLRVVDFDTSVSEKKGAKEDIAEPQEYFKQEECKDDSDGKHYDTVSGNDKTVAEETIPTGSSKTSSILRRKSKSEIFKIPLKYKLKKPELKITSLEDVTNSFKHIAHSNQKKQNMSFFNRKCSGDQKGGDTKKNNEGCKKSEEIKFLFAREMPSFIRQSRKRTKNEGAKRSTHDFKLPTDIFGFKKSNRSVDPYLYQMSCNYLNIDKTPLRKIKKGFRKQKPVIPMKDSICKHHAMRVLNSQAANFGDNGETPSIYYNLSTHPHPRRIRHRRDYSVYEEVCQRDNPCNWAKDQTVSVSPSSLVPITKCCCDAAIGSSQANLSPSLQRHSPNTFPDLSSSHHRPPQPQHSQPCPPQHSTPVASCASNALSQNKSYVVTGNKKLSDMKKSGCILNCSHNPVLSGIFRNVIAFYIKNRPSGKNCIKNMFFGLLFVVWSPCLLAVILAWVIMCPVRLTNMLAKNKTKKSFPIINSFLNKFRKKGPGSEYHRIHGENNLRQKNRNFMTSVASWSARTAGTVVNSFNAMISMLKSRPKPPPCAGSSFLTSAHPNPKRRYTLFYADNRGWMMKPARRNNKRSYNNSRVVQSMRCDIRPKFWQKIKCNQKCQAKMEPSYNNVPFECPAHGLQNAKSMTKKERSSPAGDAACFGRDVWASYSGHRNLPARLKTTRKNTSGSAMFMPVASHRLPCQQVNISPKTYDPTSVIPSSPPSYNHQLVHTKLTNLNPTRIANISHKNSTKNHLYHRKNGTLPTGIMLDCPCETKHPVITNRDFFPTYRFGLAGKTLNMSTKYTPTYKTNYSQRQSISNKIALKCPCAAKYTSRKPLCAHSASIADKRKSMIPKYIHDAYCPLKSKYSGYRKNVSEEIQRQITINRDLHNARNISLLANLSHSPLTKPVKTGTDKIELADKSQSQSVSSFRQKINSFVDKAHRLSKQSFMPKDKARADETQCLPKQSFKQKDINFAGSTQRVSKPPLNRKEMTHVSSKQSYKPKEKDTVNKTERLSVQSFKSTEINFAGKTRRLSKQSSKPNEIGFTDKSHSLSEQSFNPKEMHLTHIAQHLSKQSFGPKDNDFADKTQRSSKQCFERKEMNLDEKKQGKLEHVFIPNQIFFVDKAQSMSEHCFKRKTIDLPNTTLLKQNLGQKEKAPKRTSTTSTDYGMVLNHSGEAIQTSECDCKIELVDKAQGISKHAFTRKQPGSTDEAQNISKHAFTQNKPGLIDRAQNMSKHSFTRKHIDLADKSQKVSEHPCVRKATNLVDRGQVMSKHSFGRTDNLLDKTTSISKHSDRQKFNASLESSHPTTTTKFEVAVKCACGASQPSECACHNEFNREKVRSKHTASNKTDVICGCGADEEIDCPCVTISGPCPPAGDKLIDAHEGRKKGILQNLFKQRSITPHKQSSRSEKASQCACTTKLDATHTEKVQLKTSQKAADCSCLTDRIIDKKMVDCGCLTDKKVDKKVVECGCWTEEKIDKKVVECGCWTGEKTDKKVVKCSCWTEKKVDCPCLSIHLPCPLGVETLATHQTDASIQPFKQDAATSQQQSSQIENASQCACKSEPNHLKKSKSNKKVVECGCWTEEKIDKKMVECGCWTGEKTAKKVVKCSCWTEKKVDCPYLSIHLPCPLGVETPPTHQTDASTQPFKQDAATSQQQSSQIEKASQCACKSEPSKSNNEPINLKKSISNKKVVECACWTGEKIDKKKVECSCWTEKRVDCPCLSIHLPCPLGAETLTTHQSVAATQPLKQDAATSQHQSSQIEKASQCACKSELSESHTLPARVDKSKPNKNKVECGCWPDHKLDQKVVDCGCWTEEKVDCPCPPGTEPLSSNKMDLTQHYYKQVAASSHKRIEKATQSASTHEAERQPTAASHLFKHSKIAKQKPSVQQSNKCICENAPNARPQPSSIGRLQTIANKVHSALSKQLKQLKISDMGTNRTKSSISLQKSFTECGCGIERLPSTSGRESLHKSGSALMNLRRETKTTASQGPTDSNVKASNCDCWTKKQSTTANMKTIHRTTSTDNPKVITLKAPPVSHEKASNCDSWTKKQSITDNRRTIHNTSSTDNPEAMETLEQPPIASDPACLQQKSRITRTISTRETKHLPSQQMKSSQTQSPANVNKRLDTTGLQKKITKYSQTQHQKQSSALGGVPNYQGSKTDTKKFYSRETCFREPRQQIETTKETPTLGEASDCACQTHEVVSTNEKRTYSHKTGLEEHHPTQSIKPSQNQSSGSVQASYHRPSPTDSKKFFSHRTGLAEPSQHIEKQKQTITLGKASDCACQTHETDTTTKKSLYSNKTGLKEHPSSQYIHGTGLPEYRPTHTTSQKRTSKFSMASNYRPRKTISKQRSSQTPPYTLQKKSKYTGKTDEAGRPNKQVKSSQTWFRTTQKRSKIDIPSDYLKSSNHKKTENSRLEEHTHNQAVKASQAKLLSFRRSVEKPSYTREPYKQAPQKQSNYQPSMTDMKSQQRISGYPSSQRKNDSMTECTCYPNTKQSKHIFSRICLTRKKCPCLVSSVTQGPSVKTRNLTQENVQSKKSHSQLSEDQQPQTSKIQSSPIAQECRCSHDNSQSLDKISQLTSNTDKLDENNNTNAAKQYSIKSLKATECTCSVEGNASSQISSSKVSRNSSKFKVLVMKLHSKLFSRKITMQKKIPERSHKVHLGPSKCHCPINNSINFNSHSKPKPKNALISLQVHSRSSIGQHTKCSCLVDKVSSSGLTVKKTPLHTNKSHPSRILNISQHPSFQIYSTHTLHHSGCSCPRSTVLSDNPKKLYKSHTSLSRRSINIKSKLSKCSSLMTNISQHDECRCPVDNKSCTKLLISKTLPHTGKFRQDKADLVSPRRSQQLKTSRHSVVMSLISVDCKCSSNETSLTQNTSHHSLKSTLRRKSQPQPLSSTRHKKFQSSTPLPTSQQIPTVKKEYPRERNLGSESQTRFSPQLPSQQPEISTPKTEMQQLPSDAVSKLRQKSSLITQAPPSFSQHQPSHHGSEMSPYSRQFSSQKTSKPEEQLHPLNQSQFQRKNTIEDPTKLSQNHPGHQPEISQKLSVQTIPPAEEQLHPPYQMSQYSRKTTTGSEESPRFSQHHPIQHPEVSSHSRKFGSQTKSVGEQFPPSNKVPQYPRQTMLDSGEAPGNLQPDSTRQQPDLTQRSSFLRQTSTKRLKDKLGNLSLTNSPQPHKSISTVPRKPSIESEKPPEFAEHLPSQQSEASSYSRHISTREIPNQHPGTATNFPSKSALGTEEQPKLQHPLSETPRISTRSSIFRRIKLKRLSQKVGSLSDIISKHPRKSDEKQPGSEDQHPSQQSQTSKYSRCFCKFSGEEEQFQSSDQVSQKSRIATIGTQEPTELSQHHQTKPDISMEMPQLPHGTTKGTDGPPAISQHLPSQQPDFSRYPRHFSTQTKPSIDNIQRVPSAAVSHIPRKTTVGTEEPLRFSEHHPSQQSDISRRSSIFRRNKIKRLTRKSDEMQPGFIQHDPTQQPQKSQRGSKIIPNICGCPPEKLHKKTDKIPQHSLRKQRPSQDQRIPRKTAIGTGLTEFSKRLPSRHGEISRYSRQSSSQPTPTTEIQRIPSKEVSFPRIPDDKSELPQHSKYSQTIPLAKIQQLPPEAMTELPRHSVTRPSELSKFSRHVSSQRSHSAEKQIQPSDQMSQYPRKSTLGTKNQPGYPQQLVSEQPDISKQSSLFRTPAKRISDKLRKLSDIITKKPSKSEQKNLNVPQHNLSPQFKKAPRPLNPFRPLLPLMPGPCKCSENLRLLTLIINHLQKTTIGNKSQQNIDIPSHQPEVSQPRLHNLVPASPKEYRDSIGHFSRKSAKEIMDPPSSQIFSNRHFVSSEYSRQFSSQSISSAKEEERHQSTISTDGPLELLHHGPDQSVIYKQSPHFLCNQFKRSTKKLGSLSDIISQQQRQSDETQVGFALQKSNSKKSRQLCSKFKERVSTVSITHPLRKMSIGTQKRPRRPQHLQQSHTISGVSTCSGKKIQLSAANLANKYKPDYQVTVHRSEVEQNPLSSLDLKKQFSDVSPLLKLQIPHKTVPDDKPPPGLLQRHSSRQVRKCSANCGVRQQQLLQPAITQQSPYPDFNRVSMRYPAYISQPKRSEHISGPVQSEPIPAPTQPEHIPYPAHYYQPVAGVSPPPNYARYPCFINPANKCGPKSCDNEVALRRAYKRRPLRYTPPKQQSIPRKVPKPKKGKKAIEVAKKKKKTPSGNKLTRCCACVRDLVQEAEKEAWPTDVTCRPMYIHTMKRKPCFWIFECWPSMYPTFLSCYKFTQNIFQMFMYCLSICFWCPFIFCVYFCMDIICRSG